MAYSKAEEASEFWLLTKGILQDTRVDTEEARVICRWLEEHRSDTSFDLALERLRKFLQDGYIDRFESQTLINSIGTILRSLRTASQDATPA